MSVDAVHPGNLVPHPLRLQDLGDAIFVHPCLVATPEPVRRQASQHRQPRRQSYVSSGRLPGARAPGTIKSVRDYIPVLPPGQRAMARSAATGRGVTDESAYTPARRRHERLA